MALATIAATRGSGTTGFPAREYLKTVGVISQVLDLSKAKSIRGSALTGGDIVQLINIPANAVILGGCVEVLTATNCTVNVDIGLTGISSAGLLSNTLVNSTGVKTDNTNCGWTLPVGASGDTVDILLKTVGDGGPVSSGLIRVDVVIAEMETSNTGS